MQGVFVTGTGTGVGKTIVAAALLAALRQQGRDVLASKPLLSGLDEPALPPWPHDHELLALVTGESAEVIAPQRFGPAVSPHLAARLAGVTLGVEALAAGVRARYDDRRAAQRREPAPESAAQSPVVVVEGAGGLLVPIDDAPTNIAMLVLELGLPLVVVAHPGLGTINHVQLTLEAARARAIPIAGIVLTPWPVQPSIIEADNRAFLEAYTGVPVLTLRPIDGPDARQLAAAGLAAGLPRLV